MHFEFDHNIDKTTHQKPQLQEIFEEPIEEEKANRGEFMKGLVKLQGFFRMKKAQKIFKTMKKKLKNRRYIVDELITTEETFHNSFFLVQEKCIIPLKTQKILTKDEISELFSNLESIATFSKTFHLALSEKFKKFDPAQTKIAESVLLFLPFFRLYFDYCRNFSMAMTLLVNLRKKNKKFVEFMKTLEMQPEFQFLELDSQLIKGIQRLTKYVLFFRDLLKNTEKHHPDYANIELCIQQFSLLNNENDRKMLPKFKTFELQEKFGAALGFPIPDSHREYLEEFSLVMLTDKSTLMVTVHFLTDLMLVTEQSSYFDPKLIKHLTFDYNSYVKDLPNSKYFKYCISIFGKEGGVTFVFNDKTEKLKVIEFLNTRIFKEINMKLKSKISGLEQYHLEDYMKNKQVLTEVIGTVPRGLDHIKPFTIYIVSVKFVEIQYRIFLRYKEMLNLESYLLGLGMKNLAKLPPKHFWTEQKPRTIEARKYQVESFLRSVLSNEAIMHHKEKVLEKLGLPQNFYQIETFSQEIKQKNKDFMLNPDDPMSLLLNKRKCVYKAFLEMYKNSKRIVSPNADLQRTGPFKKIEVILPNNERLSVEISKLTKSFEVCKDLAEAAGLSSWLDFKLCLVSSAMDEIIIDDEEYLHRALDIEIGNSNENDRNNNSNNNNKKPPAMMKSVTMSKERNNDKNATIFAEIFKLPEKKNNESMENIEKKEDKSLKTWLIETKNQVSDWFDRLLERNLYCNSQLMFKKAFYLSSELEEIDYKTDLMRLDLLIHQAFAEISQNRISLSLVDYCLFASLIVYMRYGPIYGVSCLEIENLFKNAIFNNAIPTLILYKKNWEFWFENVCWYWKIFSDEIELTIKKNEQFNAKIAEKTLESLCKGKECEIQKKTTDGSVIAKFVFLKCLSRTTLYGNHRFYVTLVTSKEQEMNIMRIREEAKQKEENKGNMKEDSKFNTKEENKEPSIFKENGSRIKEENTLKNKNENKTIKTVWFAVSYEKLRFLDDKNCKEFITIGFEEIDSLNANSAYVEIGWKNEKILFYTMKGFEIKDIIETYKRVKKVVAGLGNRKKKRGKNEDKKFRRSGFIS